MNALEMVADLLNDDEDILIPVDVIVIVAGKGVEGRNTISCRATDGTSSWTTLGMLHTMIRMVERA